MKGSLLAVKIEVALAARSKGDKAFFVGEFKDDLLQLSSWGSLPIFWKFIG